MSVALPAPTRAATQNDLRFVKITAQMAVSVLQEWYLMMLMVPAAFPAENATVPMKVKLMLLVPPSHLNADHVPVLEVNGLVSLSRALGLAVLKEVPTFQHLMRNTIPSLETVVMS